jgi:hypothetical protein
LREKYPDFNSWRTCRIENIKKLSAAEQKSAKLDPNALALSDVQKLDNAQLREYCLYNGLPVNLAKAKTDKDARLMVDKAIKEKNKAMRKTALSIDDTEAENATQSFKNPVDGLE